jgi:hypothetical protein
MIIFNNQLSGLKVADTLYSAKDKVVDTAGAVKDKTVSSILNVQ